MPGLHVLLQNNYHYAGDSSHAVKSKYFGDVISEIVIDIIMLIAFLFLHTFVQGKPSLLQSVYVFVSFFF